MAVLFGLSVIVRVVCLKLSLKLSKGGCPMKKLKNKLPNLLGSGFCLADSVYAVSTSFVASALFARSLCLSVAAIADRHDELD
jgi:hypothetical protein